MPRVTGLVLTAQLFVDKHHAMVLANVTFKALAAIWHRHADMRRVEYTRNYGHYKKCGALDDERQTGEQVQQV